tara:strand:+ start:500 stop:670 length:171 start_codon:yes stop_codon:yes gene_type:complete
MPVLLRVFSNQHTHLDLVVALWCDSHLPFLLGDENREPFEKIHVLPKGVVLLSNLR